jgi:hypothetical protein
MVKPPPPVQLLCVLRARRKAVELMVHLTGGRRGRGEDEGICPSNWVLGIGTARLLVCNDCRVPAMTENLLQSVGFVSFCLAGVMRAL